MSGPSRRWPTAPSRQPPAVPGSQSSTGCRFEPCPSMANKGSVIVRIVSTRPSDIPQNGRKVRTHIKKKGMSMVRREERLFTRPLGRGGLILQAKEQTPSAKSKDGNMLAAAQQPSPMKITLFQRCAQGPRCDASTSIFLAFLWSSAHAIRHLPPKRDLNNYYISTG